YTLIGSGQAVFGEELSFKAKTEGQQINIERLNAANQSAGESQDGSDRKDLSVRLASFANLLDRIPRFEAEGDIDIALPAVIAGDTVVRDITLNMRPLGDADGWQLSNVKAQLPGRTEFRADGALTFGSDPSWNGDLIVASKQPSGLAKWLAPNVDPAIRTMSGAGFSASASIDAKSTELANLEIVLDGAQLRGSLRREAGGEGRPKLNTVLSGSRADFDQLAALFRLFAGEKETGTFAAHDIDVRLDVAELAVSGFVAKDVSGALIVADGALKADNISIGDLDGARVEAQATFEGFPNALTGEASGRFAAADPVPLLQKLAKTTNRFSLPKRFVDDPALLADMEITLDLKPESKNTRGSVSGRVGGSKVDWRFMSDGLIRRAAQQDVDSTLILDNDNAAQLLQQLGLPVVPGEFGGRGAFRTVVKGVAANGVDVQAALTMGSGYATAAGVLTDRFDGTLRVRSEIEDLDPFIRLSGMAIPSFGQGLSGEVTGTVEFDGKLARLTEVEGELGGSRFSGTLEIDRNATPRPSVKGWLNTDLMSLETLAAAVFSAGAQHSDRLFSGLDGDLSVSAERLELPGAMSTKTGDIEQAEARLLILDGDMVFEDISARFGGGRITGRTSLGQSAAAMAVGGQLTLVDGEAEKLASLVANTPWLTGDISVSGSFESAGEGGAALLSGLTGSGTISMKNGALLGVADSALSPILKSADALDDEQMAKKTAEIVGPVVVDGVFEFAEAQAAFSIASGVVRAGNVHLENKRAALDADLSLDLASNEVEADASIKYQAGREAVVAATPEFSLNVTGAPESLTVKTDTSLFSTYLGLRLSERKQREFEAQKASILERQRLLRTARLYELKEEKRRLQKEEQERIEKLRAEEQQRRRLEQIRRAREALEQAKLEADLKAAEQQADTEAAAEAGRRAKRQEQIDLLRRRAEQESEKRKNATDAELLDFKKLEGG
ncbi:MAG: AsmA-like C-terminal region-containing protein, partial [Rhizobiaceae bacterium]